MCGPSYALPNKNADAQKLQNMYLERGGPDSKSAFQMYGSPGLTLFSVCGNGPVRAELNANQRSFQVSGDTLYEVFTDGTNTAIGVVGDDGQPASMANSATQLAVVSNGQLFVVDLGSSTLTPVDTGLGPVRMVGYDDAYFVCLITDSQKFQISSLLDATTWDPTDVTQVSVFPDKVLSMIVDHREIGLFGVTKSVWYGNTGAVDFPFSPIPSSFIEQGIAAAWCRDRLDNSVFWLGADDRGSLMAWRAQGYTPARVSNHAVEAKWQSYATTSDAISYAYQMNGHTFWRIWFPTANATWEYDVATDSWCEPSYLDNGLDTAHLSRCHTFVFGLHLVGSRKDGSVYVMSLSIPDDNGQPIKRVRRAPHISIEQQWMFGNQFQLDAEVGNSAIFGTLLPHVPYLLTFEPDCPLTGDVYAVLIGRDPNKPRYISPILGPITINPLTNSPGITVPVIPGVVSWQFLFANDVTTGPTSGFILTDSAVNTFVSFGAPRTVPYSFINIAPSSRVTFNYSINWLTQPRDPIVFLNRSKDGGHTYQTIFEMTLGKVGEYEHRCIARRLGRWRDCVWEIEYSDTAPFRIVDAYLIGTGNTAQQRLPDQLKQRA
jgi:hypothetical protein